MSSEGDYFCLVLDYKDGDAERMYSFCAYSRGRDPKLSIYALCMPHDRPDGDVHLDLDVVDGQFVWKTNFDFAVHALDQDDVDKVVIQKVIYANREDSLQVKLLGHEVLAELLVGAKAKGKAKAKAAPAPAEADAEDERMAAGFGALHPEPHIPRIDLDEPNSDNSEQEAGDDRHHDDDSESSANDDSDLADDDSDEGETSRDEAPDPPLPPPVMGPGFDTSHTYLWITRTNRAATCQDCKAKIPPWEFRALFLPHPDSVLDQRQWGKLWWRYYHLERCISNHVSIDMAHKIEVDAMRQKSESPDEFDRMCQGATEALIATLRSSRGSGAGSSTDAPPP